MALTQVCPTSLFQLPLDKGVGWNVSVGQFHGVAYSFRELPLCWEEGMYLKTGVFLPVLPSTLSNSIIKRKFPFIVGI